MLVFYVQGLRWRFLSSPNSFFDNIEIMVGHMVCYILSDANHGERGNSLSELW